MIFYFSGTGNTRWAAERLAEATGERLLFIPDELKKLELRNENRDKELQQGGECHYELQEGERLGFCFPVHGWQPPHIVRRFIRKMTINSPSYCYALVTCGDSIGRTMEMLQKELAPKNIKLDSMFSLVMPESYVCLPFMYTDTPEREQQKISQAGKELEQYAEIVVGKLKGEVHTQRGFTPWTFSHVIGAYFNSQMISDKKFTVDSNLCIHCGRCENVCPTGDVKLHDGLPQWLHDGTCTNCLACYHYCPQHAINYGNITRRRGQYYFGHRQVE